MFMKKETGKLTDSWRNLIGKFKTGKGPCGPFLGLLMSCRITLRQGTTHKNCTRVRAEPARPYQEDRVLTGLECRLQLAEIGLAIDRLLVDFQDDIAPA